MKTIEKQTAEDIIAICKEKVKKELQLGKDGHFAYVVGLQTESEYERPLQVDDNLWVRFHAKQSTPSSMLFTVHRNKPQAEMGWCFEICHFMIFI